MKPLIQIPIVILTLSSIGICHAAQITNSFDNVPSGVQCGETWTNQNIILNFTPTVASEDGSGGYCYFGVGPGYVWLFPSRLRLDFSLLPQPVSRIEADIQAYGGTAVFAYSGTNNIAQTGSATNGTYSLAFTSQHPDSCALRSFEGRVTQVRIFTEETSSLKLSIKQTNGTIAIIWATNLTSFVLEKTDHLTEWTTETNNIQTEGTNFVYYIATPTGVQFFRLRQN